MALKEKLAALAQALGLPPGHELEALADYAEQASNGPMNGPFRPYDAAADEERKKAMQEPEGLLNAITGLGREKVMPAAARAAPSGPANPAVFPTPEKSMENMQHEAVLRDSLAERGRVVDPAEVKASLDSAAVKARNPPGDNSLQTMMRRSRAIDQADGENMLKHIEGRRPGVPSLHMPSGDSWARDLDRSSAVEAGLPLPRPIVGGPRVAPGVHELNVQNAVTNGANSFGAEIPPSKNLPGQSELEEYFNRINKGR